jgi:RNA polymerase sigma-70 factor (ECF subfamily)
MANEITPVPARSPKGLGVRVEGAVAQIQRPDRLAFEALYELHHPGIVSFCRQILRSEHDAEDAAQQAFLSAYEHLAGGERPTHPRAWLYAIARNHCLMMLRRRRRAETVPPNPRSREMAEEIEERSDLGRLVTDLLELPDDQRLALVLLELGDLSHAHIADILECKPSKVKSLVYQARRALRRRATHATAPAMTDHDELDHPASVASSGDTVIASDPETKKATAVAEAPEEKSRWSRLEDAKALAHPGPRRDGPSTEERGSSYGAVGARH